MTNHTSHDKFKEISRASQVYIPAIIRRLLVDGRVEGGEYVALNPTRQDSKLGSFKINLRTGKWADFATGDRGGDIISLYGYIQNTTQLEALKAISQMIGYGGHRHG